MNNMTPSKAMLSGQIDKAVANYRAMLEKHAPTFNSEAVQTALGQSELAADQLTVFRNKVEALSTIIIRRVTVNRKRSLKEALDATGRKQYVNESVLIEMPNGIAEEADVVLWKPGYYVSAADFEEEYEKMSKVLGYEIVPVDLATLAALNEEDPAFADQRPNCTQHKNAKGKYNFATFGRWLGGERRVDVDQSGSDWSDDWWFAGVRK